MAKSHGDGHQQIRVLGERIAQSLGIPPTDVRYAQYVLHDGRQWTVGYQWEVLRDGRWDVLADDKWMDLHGSPRRGEADKTV